MKSAIIAASQKVLAEASKKTMVFSVGRLNPPTIGHQEMVEELRDIAKKEGADFAIIPTKSFDKKKNPLPFAIKIKFIRAGLPKGIKSSNVMTDPDVKNPFQAVSKLFEKYDNLIMVVGGDRVAEFKKGLVSFAEKKFPGKTLKIVSSGERQPGISASAMRASAVANDFASFEKGTMTNLPLKQKKAMFKAVQDGMGVIAQIEEMFESENQQEQILEMAHNQIEDDMTRGWMVDVYRNALARLGFRKV